jgi:hypothetical protein
MIKDWHRPGPEDRAWLMYSANYLFRTNNVHWAMDPMRLKQRVPEAPVFDIAQDLNKLSFVLLTHGHADHLDFELIRALRHLSILWILPEDILYMVQNETGLPSDKIIVPKPLQHIDIQGVRITSFDGLHWEMPADVETNTLRGMPATGYLIEFKDRRWLFPGDTRTYNAGQLPAFGSVDGLFAHLWLGRGGALLEDPPLLDEFCRFLVDLLPKRVILTHLEEFGRDTIDFWDIKHVQKVSSWFQKNAPNIHLNSACLGEGIII